jgi:[pyruvate, water dikinase]-phosphate phosphotransferase / [pyruvate, water dikinase] kinase
LAHAMPNRTVFFVSDGTGITAETFGNSILNQFADAPAPCAPALHRHRGQGRRRCCARSTTAAEREGKRPIVFITLVNDEVREHLTTGPARAWCWTCSAPSSSRWRPSSASSPTTASAASPMPAKSEEYHDRIEAINFSLAHDDGQSARNLDSADVILVGVSRSGKTPTSLYLAMQHGIKAANYPLIPEDFERGKLPHRCAHKTKCFGLTIDPSGSRRSATSGGPAASTRRSRTAAMRSTRPRR